METAERRTGKRSAEIIYWRVDRMYCINRNSRDGESMEIRKSGTVPVLLIVLFAIAGAGIPNTTALSISNPDLIFSENVFTSDGVAISGDRIVWATDCSNEKPGTAGVFLFNATTRELLPLFTHNGWSEKGSVWTRNPDISGNFVVWEGNGAIHVYNISAGEEITLTESGYLHNIHPAVSGDRVVWAEQTAWAPNLHGTDITLYNLTTGVKEVVCDDPADQVHPSIDGDIVVWEDLRNGNEDIYLYDLSTGEERPVCTDPSPQRSPVVSGNRVVWEDRRYGNSDIFMTDLATSEELQVTQDLEEEYSADICGDLVLWHQSTYPGLLAAISAGPCISLHDLGTGETVRVSPDGWRPYSPAVGDGYLAFVDARFNRFDLYLVQVERDGTSSGLVQTADAGHPGENGEESSPSQKSPAAPLGLAAVLLGLAVAGTCIAIAGCRETYQ